MHENYIFALDPVFTSMQFSPAVENSFGWCLLILQDYQRFIFSVKVVLAQPLLNGGRNIAVHIIVLVAEVILIDL